MQCSGLTAGACRDRDAFAFRESFLKKQKLEDFFFQTRDSPKA